MQGWQRLSHPLVLCTCPKLYHPKQFPSPTLVIVSSLRLYLIHGLHHPQEVLSYVLDYLIYSGPHQHFRALFQLLNLTSSAIQALDSIT